MEVRRIELVVGFVVVHHIETVDAVKMHHKRGFVDCTIVPTPVATGTDLMETLQAGMMKAGPGQYIHPVEIQKKSTQNCLLESGSY